jgi:outer membrane protein TolC
MKNFLSFLMTALLVCGATPPLSAEEMVSADKGGIQTFDKNAFIASADVKRTLQIGMVDCVAMALKNNSEIRIERIVPLIESSNVRIQKARFEPRLTFDFTMEDDTDLSTSTLIGSTTSKTRTGDFDFGFDQTFVTGTKVELDLYNLRTRSNSAIQTMNPTYDSKGGITITQPLLKGFGIIVNKADFLIAKNNKLKSEQQLIQEIIKVLTDVKKDYHAFQYSREQYKVAETSLERVKSLYNINKEKYIKGLASNVDLLESEAEVARFEELYCEADREMRQAEDNFKLITNLIDDVELWNAEIELLDPISYEKKDVELVEAVNTAFDHRPDYKAAIIDLKNKDISVIFYRNNMLPTLDLAASYGLNGLGREYAKDMDNLGSGKYPDWTIGVNFKLPLFSDKEKGEYEKSKFEKARALIAFKRLEQKIVLEVRNAVRDVDINYKKVEASRISKEAETKNYEAQESRFRAGLVSTLDMLIYLERLAKAELAFARSVIDYKISLAELARVKGTILSEDNITLELT